MKYENPSWVKEILKIIKDDEVQIPRQDLQDDKSDNK